MKHVLARSSCVAAITLAGMALAPQVFAQGAAAAQGSDAPANDTGSATSGAVDIVVTAQRKSESIQATPLSVTALSSETLQNFGVREFRDVAKTIPGLSYGGGGSVSNSAQGYGASGGTQIVIRGVSGSNTTSLYIDDTPIPSAINVRALDLERVEVLRGPQGTLFGASSMGGTIKFVTKKPSLVDSSGYVNAQATQTRHGGEGYDAAASVTVPLIKDELALSLSGFSSLQPGYFKKQYGVAAVAGVDFQPGQQVVGTLDDVGEFRSHGGMATLYFKPSSVEGLEITANAIYQSSRRDGLAYADGSPSNLVQVRALNAPEYSREKFEFYSLSARYDVGVGSLVSSSSLFYRKAKDVEDGSLQLAQVTPFWYGAGLSSPYFPTPSSVTFNSSQFTQELRFESDFDFPVQIVVGGFYQRTKSNYVFLSDSRALIDGTDTVISTAFLRDAPNVTKQYAGFADLTWSITPKLEVSAGGRIAHQSFDQDNTFSIGGGPSQSASASQKQSPFTPRFVAKYSFDSRNIVYASASKGFRAGGTNSIVPPGCNPEASGVASNSPNPYGSDSLWSYEAGIKNSFFGNKIYTRAAAYHMKWDKIQQPIFIPQCGLQVTDNVGAAKIDGAELEIGGSLAEGLTFSSGLGYTDARITSSRLDASGNPVGFPVGTRMSNVPKWSGFFRGEYTVPVGEAEAFFRGQYSYTGKSVSLANGLPGFTRKSYQLVDVRAGFSITDWQVSLFANNLFDVRANLGDLVGVTALPDNEPRFAIATPRTVGIELRRNF